MVTVVFTTDFANKKKGEVFECNSLLASQLINGDKVAEYFVEKVIEKKATKTKKD